MLVNALKSELNVGTVLANGLAVGTLAQLYALSVDLDELNKHNVYVDSHTSHRHHTLFLASYMLVLS